MNHSLAEKNILITGGAKRIGAHLARQLAKKKARLAISYRESATEAQELITELRDAGATAYAFQADFNKPNTIEQLFESVQSALGPIEYLINNASSFTPGEIHSLTNDQMQADLAVHLMAPLQLCRLMAERLPNQSRGSIVNLLDWRAHKADPRFFSYGISKSALLHATKQLALALAPKLTVNAIAPGSILPPEHLAESQPASTNWNGWQDAPWDMLSEAKAIPLQKQGSLDDIWQACEFLLQQDYVTGCLLPVDGGRHLL